MKKPKAGEPEVVSEDEKLVQHETEQARELPVVSVGEVKFKHHTRNQVVLSATGFIGRVVKVYVNNEFFGQSVIQDETVIVQGSKSLRISGETFTWEVD